jgi:hypothetical protein
MHSRRQPHRPNVRLFTAVHLPLSASTSAQRVLPCRLRKKVYRSIDELRADLDLWVCEYNERRPHQGRWCFGKTPMQTFLDAMPLAKEKMIAA